MTEAEESRADIRERSINAVPASVFAALSSPDRLARWWGPDGFTNTFEEFDFTPGHVWRYTMHGPDGKNYRNESVFLDIIPDERVVIEHHSGHHFILTITFMPVDDGTLVGWRQVFDTTSHYRQIAMFVAQANEQNLDRLEAEVERENVSERMI